MFSIKQSPNPRVQQQGTSLPNQASQPPNQQPNQRGSNIQVQPSTIQYKSVQIGSQQPTQYMTNTGAPVQVSFISSFAWVYDIFSYRMVVWQFKQRLVIRSFYKILQVFKFKQRMLVLRKVLWSRKYR